MFVLLKSFQGPWFVALLRITVSHVAEYTPFPYAAPDIVHVASLPLFEPVIPVVSESVVVAGVVHGRGGGHSLEVELKFETVSLL